MDKEWDTLFEISHTWVGQIFETCQGSPPAGAGHGHLGGTNLNNYQIHVLVCVLFTTPRTPPGPSPAAAVCREASPPTRREL